MLLTIVDMLLGKNKQVSIMFGDKYCFLPKDRLIILDHHNPSIISTLHEIGHAKFGPNELKACAWSVQMFQTVFPKAYSKLEWHGHMLKKGAT